MVYRGEHSEVVRGWSIAKSLGEHSEVIRG